MLIGRLRLSRHLSLALLLAAATPLQAQHNEGWDGSYRLDTGEVITGGYFVEEGVGRFLFMDTERLERIGLFETVDDTTLRSLTPPGTITMTFDRDVEGRAQRVTWQERGAARVQGYRVFPFHSDPIEFYSTDGTLLHGRLLMPACPGSFPLVVSVHGSGPTDRHGGPYQTWFLRHGIAVLSYDKRGYTPDRQDWQEPDYAQLTNDVVAAASFARMLPGVDSTRIGIFGSSQAGWVVPPATQELPWLRFLILRAGAGMSAAETARHEIRQELRHDGLSGLDLDFALQLREAIHDAAIRGEPLIATDRLVTPYLHAPWYGSAFGDGLLSARWSAHSWDWNRRNLATTPIPALEQYRGSVLWFLAERDENVPLVATRTALERAFAASPGDDQRVVTIPDALHSFLIPAENGTPHFAHGFFDVMGEWLKERGLVNAGCPWTAVQ